jgi:hypothetical protein
MIVPVNGVMARVHHFIFAGKRVTRKAMLASQIPQIFKGAVSQTRPLRQEVGAVDRKAKVHKQTGCLQVESQRVFIRRFFPASGEERSIPCTRYPPPEVLGAPLLELFKTDTIAQQIMRKLLFVKVSLWLLSLIEQATSHKYIPLLGTPSQHIFFWHCLGFLR